MLPTLYARQEPTTDRAVREFRRRFPMAHGPQRFDVQLYYDPGCTKPAGRFPWHYSNRPRLSSKTCMLNCQRWSLTWVPKSLPDADTLAIVRTFRV